MKDKIKKRSSFRAGRIIFAAAVLLVLIICVSSAIAMQKAPEFIRQKLLDTMRSGCPRCKIELASIELGALNGEIILNDFSYIDTTDHETQIDVKLRKLTVHADPMHFFPGQSGPIIIHSVLAEKVDFTITEDAKYSTPQEHTPALSGLPPLVIERVEAKNSIFRYVEKVHPKHAVLLLSDVNGSVGSWVTRRDLASKYAPSMTPIFAQGILEHSGEFEIKAEADALSTEGTAHIHVDVRNHDLKASDEFFRAECGIGLEGSLIKSSTDFQIKEGIIDGTLIARYKKLKVKVVSRNNSGVKNFIETLGAKIVLDSEQGAGGKPIGEKNFHEKRSYDQSLYSAIFHGLGKAARDLVRG